jgi:hypothetical protein
MTTFDEEKLRQALQTEANGFVISKAAMEGIIDEARDSDEVDEPSRIRSFVERTGSFRSTVMAAAASVIVVAVAVPLFTAETNPAVTSASRASLHAGPRKVALNALPLPVAPNTGITGTGFLDVVGGTNVQGTVASTGSTVQKSVTQAGAQQANSSLRVEEVGTIRLSVGAKRFQSTLSQLTDFATTDGGFVASTQSHIGTKANHSFSTGTIVLQVPEHHFTMLVDQVRHAGLATSVVTSANDVSGQYVDLQARISALKVSRAQYLKIMTRTNSINGILSVQNQLNSIQSQIEQLQAQLNLLNSETTYATLTVSLSQVGHVANTPKHPATGIDKAWHESLHGFAAGFEWLIRIAGPLLFALLLLAALLLLGRVTWRATERRRSRNI